MQHAHGTFTVKVAPLTPAPAEGLGRFSIDKEIHGDLEATTKGEMFSRRRSEGGRGGVCRDRSGDGSAGGQDRAASRCSTRRRWMRAGRR